MYHAEAHDNRSLPYLFANYTIAPPLHCWSDDDEKQIPEINNAYKFRLKLLKQFKNKNGIPLSDDFFNVTPTVSASKKFFQLYKFAQSTQSSQSDPQVNEFLKWFLNYENLETPLSKYIIETTLNLLRKRAFLMGTHAKEAENKESASSVYKFRSNVLFDRNLFSGIFGFMSDDNPTKSREEEKRETDQETSIAEDNALEEAEKSKIEWQKTLIVKS